MTRSGLVAALDLGTAKVCCLIARIGGAGDIRVVGIGHQAARGVRSGGIASLEQAEQSVRAAVEAAERMADERVDEVLVAVNCGAPASRRVGAETPLNGHAIGDSEVRRLLAQADAACASSDQIRLHAIPTGYAIDGSRGVRDPRGLFGERLGVQLHVATATPGPLRNLRAVVERCHLQVERFVAAPFASALSVLVEDEMDLGAVLLDMGAGTTSVALYYDGHLVHLDVVPVGGGHVTNDIARGLSTPWEAAERMKTLYGSAIPGPSDERETLSVPQVGEERGGEAQQIPRSILIGIIQPRIEETLELVRERLLASGYAGAVGRRLVLTGGACQLPGVRELAARILDKQARIGRPLQVRGLAESTSGPAFAAAAGLLRYAADPPSEAMADDRTTHAPTERPLARLAGWLRGHW